MKIFELINVLNRSDILLNESMGLPELRRHIIKNEMHVDPNEEDWYRDENNRNELIDNMSKIVGPTPDPMLNLELKKFNTSNYTEKGRIVKPKSLNNALELEILRVKNSNKNDNNDLSSQYEKLKIKKDIEIYSVFTPAANIELSHKILKNNEEPTWCIASPTGAAQAWAMYDLWDAEYPCVFIVVKHGTIGGIRNPKYEIKCNPKLSEQFAKGECSIFDFIDEVRDAEQNEEGLDDTSLFKVIGIDEQTLENAIRKLMNTDKAYSFSKKYGANYNARFNKLENDEQISSNERIQLLIDACKRGSFDSYIEKAKASEISFFIDRLIEYKTLNERMLYIYRHFCISNAIGFNFNIFNKIFNFLIKNKKCTADVLRAANELNYPGIDEIYDKVFNSMVINNPMAFTEIFADEIKKEYLEKYLKVLHPKSINKHCFSEIIRTHELNLNQIESICKIFFEKGNTLRALVAESIKYNTMYIPVICSIASKLKKIDQEDIKFLYCNYGIDEVWDAIDELDLKIPENFFEPMKVKSIIASTVKNDTNIKNITNSLILLCKVLSDYSKLKSRLHRDYLKSNYLPEVSDIIKSDPRGSSEESKIHRLIILTYKQNKLDLKEINYNCEDLDAWANYNAVREFFNKFGSGDDYYYNKFIDGESITPYDLYRNMLYDKFASLHKNYL